MAITLRQLEYIHAVVAEGSIIGAARRLLVSQPSLSVAIRELERHLDTPLVARSARGIEPTDAGYYLAGAAERILNDIESAERHVKELGEGLIGEVALAVTPTYSWHYLPQLLEEVAARAPGLRVSLRDPAPMEILQLVGSGEADLGIVVVHDLATLQRVYGTEFEFQPIRDIKVVAALPSRLAHLPDPVSMEDLGNEAWILPIPARDFPGISSLIQSQWRAAGIHPRVIQEVSTTQTGLPLVAAGIGIMLAPESILHVTDLSLEVRQLSVPVTPLTAVLLWRRGAFMRPASRQILEFILESQ